MGTISKALTLLNFFSPGQAEIGLSQFVRLSGADKATVRRHLVELEKNGFLEQHPESRKYRLGPALLRLASVRERNFPIRSAIAPIVDRMAEQLGELVHASLLQGDMMSPFYHADPQVHGTRVIFDESELLPLHATASGLAMLAFGPEGILDIAIAATRASYAPNTVVAKSDLIHLVEQTRARGYAYSDAYYTKEVASFGMPFFGVEGHAIGTIAIPVPAPRLDPALQARILTELRVGCEDTTRSFGGEVPAEITQVWDQPRH